jgi:hypothetical protein
VLKVLRRETYYGYFATKLVFDLARLDSVWGMLLDELEEMFDSHVGGRKLSAAVATELGQSGHGKAMWREVLRRVREVGGEEVTIGSRRVAGIRALTASALKSWRYAFRTGVLCALDFAIDFTATAQRRRRSGFLSSTNHHQGISVINCLFRGVDGLPPERAAVPFRPRDCGVASVNFTS